MQDWAAENAGTFTDGADPLTPLMDALAMAYRVAFAIGKRFMRGRC